MRISTKPRIVSVEREGGSWRVRYMGRVLVEKPVKVTRTHNLKTGALLKKPVIETQIQQVPMSGEIEKVVKRRKSLRRLGVKI